MSSETMELPKLSVDNVRPHIELFTRGLTAEQWSLLAAGKPDNDTRLRLADMLVKVLCALVDVMSDFFKQDSLVDHMRDTLDDSIARSFADALGVETVKGPASDHLTELLVTEVIASNGSGQPKPTNAMIRSVCKMLKKCAHKMRCMCCTVKQSRRSSVHSSANTEVSSMTQSVQYIISGELNQIIGPIVEDIPDTEYNQLQEEFSVDIQSAAEDIAQSVTEFKETASTHPSPKAQQNGLRTKICNFFAKMFAKASICRIFSQVKAKFHSKARVRDSDSVKSLLDDAESVLQTSGKILMSEEEVCMLRKLEKISREDVFDLTGEFSNLLYSHVTGEMVPTTFREAAHEMVMTEPQPHATIYDDIQRRVICFLSLMSWWLENQVRSYSDRVMQALLESERVTIAQMPLATVVEEPEPYLEEAAVPATGDAAQTEVSRACLRLVITTLIKKVWRAVKGDRTFFTDLEFTIQRLVDATLAQLEGSSVNITPGNVETLNKAIFKHLSKKWGSATRVLISMERRDPDLPKCIGDFCKTRLNKQRSAIFRFFSA